MPKYPVDLSMVTEEIDGKMDYLNKKYVPQYNNLSLEDAQQMLVRVNLLNDTHKTSMTNPFPGHVDYLTNRIAEIQNRDPSIISQDDVGINEENANMYAARQKTASDAAAQGKFVPKPVVYDENGEIMP